jgi:hypothetical protein
MMGRDCGNRDVTRIEPFDEAYKCVGHKPAFDFARDCARAFESLSIEQPDAIKKPIEKKIHHGSSNSLTCLSESREGLRRNWEREIAKSLGFFPLWRAEESKIFDFGAHDVRFSGTFSTLALPTPRVAQA